MKFVCDRCKTRYSIGDDRVRGKILKIRCKNCANVITVREGMTAGDDAADTPNVVQPGRSPKKTTLAPAAAHTAPAPAAAAAAATDPGKPPAALDEEWYVSIDGEQSGPFSLAEAQRWVAGKPVDAELHCWCEGFDDWLPVDKVSHFRGLRKKPIANTPPPTPRAQHHVTPQPARARAEVEEEPKPLFAATMASLESAAARTAAEAARPRATPARGVTAARNGSAQPAAAAAAPAQAQANGKTGPVVALAGAPATKPVGTGSVGALSARTPAPARPATRPGVGSSLAASTAAPGPRSDVPGFDTPPSAVGDDESGATRIEAPAFVDSPAMAASPVGAFAASAAAANAALGSPAPAAGDEADDDMEIGEVSRVVNLADIARPPRGNASAASRRSSSMLPRAGTAVRAEPDALPAAFGAVAPGHATGPQPVVPGGLGYAPGFEGAGAYLPGAAPGMADAPIAAEVPLAPPQVTQRRTMIALLVVAVLLVAAAGGVVAYIVMSGGDDTPVTLADHDQTIDSSRPDDPTYRNPLMPQLPPQQRPDPGRLQLPYHPHPTSNTPNPDHSSNGRDEQIGPNTPLTPDEVEDMYQRSNANTQRCWERAQKKDPYVVKDVKRVVVTLSVAADGGIASVAFAGLPQDDIGNLGPCLSSMVKNWRFRATKDGLTAKITMAFQ